MFLEQVLLVKGAAHSCSGLMKRQFTLQTTKRRFSSSFGLRYDRKQDFYEILGVPPRSKEVDIKKAYYKLAQIYHPDKAHGNKAFEEKFKSISAAYEVLKDES